MKTIATIALAAGIALSPVIAQAAFQGPAAAFSQLGLHSNNSTASLPEPGTTRNNPGQS